MTTNKNNKDNNSNNKRIIRIIDREYNIIESEEAIPEVVFNPNENDMMDELSNMDSFREYIHKKNKELPI
jgi:hypothetical protein